MALRLGEITGVIECRIVKRLNRFVVEILVEGFPSRAHINNTGRLKGLMVEGRKAYCLRNPRKGKTSYRLFAVSEEGGSAALIDTWMQMLFFERALTMEAIPWLNGCRILRRNARLGSSLIDYLLNCSRGVMYLEVKSAVLRGDHVYAMYPDCPTVRGRRHIKELLNHVAGGGLGAFLFIAALPEVRAFKPNSLGDPVFSTLLRKAKEAGVLLKSIGMHYDPSTSAVYLDDPELRVEL